MRKVLVLLAGFMLLGAAPVHGQPKLWRAAIVPGVQPTVSSLNNNNEIVGRVCDKPGAPTATYWHYDPVKNVFDRVEKFTFPGVNYSYALWINDGGYVVVHSTNSIPDNDRSFIWKPTTGYVKELLSLIGTSGFTYPSCINNHLTVAGHANDGVNINCPPCIWPSGNSQPQPLDSPAGAAGGVRGINDLDEVVGCECSARTNNQNNAVSWTPETWRNLDPGGAWSEAIAINNKGQIVGFITTDDGYTHAWLWGPVGWGDPLLPISDYSTTALGINNGGAVVGLKGSTPVLWPNINDWPAGGPDYQYLDHFIFQSVVSVWEPRGINDRWQIIGSGKSQGVACEFLLTPIPPMPMGGSIVGSISLLLLK